MFMCLLFYLPNENRYLELHNWNVHESIAAAKADIEWEKSHGESGSFDDECKTSPIEPPSTSCYKVIHYDDDDNTNVNVRLTQGKADGRHTMIDAANEKSAKLLELKASRDAAERWEELSHPSSYKSCIDNSEKLPLPRLVVGMQVPVVDNENNQTTACFEDYQKVRRLNFTEKERKRHSILCRLISIVFFFPYSSIFIFPIPHIHISHHFTTTRQAPPIDFGIEMKELNTIVPHPAVVTVTR